MSARTFFSALTRPGAALLLLLAAVLAVYAPTLGGAFVWDDNALVKNCLLIRSPLCGLEVFRHTLFDGNSNFYRPTQQLTYIFDYWAWGLNPYGYHLTNILIHAVNAWLLFLVLRGVLSVLLPRRSEDAGDKQEIGAFALVIALVWALHPVHSAAVAYVSGRADTLAAGFCLGAWLLTERAFAAHGARRLGLSAGAFVCLVLGFCSKEIAFVWLALFSGYLLGTRGDLPLRRRLLAIGAGLLGLLVYVGLRSLPPAPPPVPPYPVMPARWLLMIRALGDYARLLLFPDRLFMERQVFAAPGLANPADDFVYFALGVGGVLLLAAFAFGAWRAGRGQTMRRAGAAWFLLAFLPISNLFKLNASVAEHWLYLPSIGFLIFLAGAALELSRLRLPRLAPLAAAALGLAVCALGARTYYRGFDWMDESTFFRQTIQDGGDVPRARLGLANSFSKAGNDVAAVPLLQEVAAKYPRVLTARINLANALARLGRIDEARPVMERAAADILRGGNDPAQAVVAVRSLDALEAGTPGWPERRRTLLAEAVRLYPDAWAITELRLQDCEREHALDEALAMASRFAVAHWWHAPARHALGCVYAEMGRTREALTTFALAARLDVHDAESLGAAAEICLEGNRLAEARSLQAHAVDRQPDSPKQRLLLAAVLERCGEPTLAAVQSAEAGRMMRENSGMARN